MGFMGIHYDLNELINEFQDKVDKTPQLGINLVDGIAEDIRDAMVIEAPFKWGMLKELHVVETVSDWIREIFSLAPYFDIVVGGSSPHDIYPLSKKALYWPGADYPVKHVYHPGTAPNDYPSRAIVNADGAINTRVNEFLDQVVN